MRQCSLSLRPWVPQFPPLIKINVSVSCFMLTFFLSSTAPVLQPSPAELVSAIQHYQPVASIQGRAWKTTRPKARHTYKTHLSYQPATTEEPMQHAWWALLEHVALVIGGDWAIGMHRTSPTNATSNLGNIIPTYQIHRNKSILYFHCTKYIEIHRNLGNNLKVPNT